MAHIHARHIIVTKTAATANQNLSLSDTPPNSSRNSPNMRPPKIKQIPKIKRIKV